MSFVSNAVTFQHTSKHWDISCSLFLTFPCHSIWASCQYVSSLAFLGSCASGFSLGFCLLVLFVCFLCLSVFLCVCVLRDPGTGGLISELLCSSMYCPQHPAALHLKDVCSIIILLLSSIHAFIILLSV